jgi:predicted ATPase
MRIKKLRLKNGYKRFRDLTIDLGDAPARVVALVGPNGCGKSSVLDGLLFHANAWARLGNTDDRGYSYHSMDGLADYNYQNVEIEFVEGSFHQVRERLVKAGKGTTIMSFRSPYRYNSELKISATRAMPAIGENDYGASDSASLDAKMEGNYRRLFAKFNAYRDRNDVKPSEARAKIVGDLNDSLRKCLDMEVSSLGNVEASQGTLYFRKPDHEKEFEFNVLSSGEKEVVDILLDLYLRQEDYTETIFLLDEPELHINTAIQKNLLIEIDRLVGKDCQIWISTHSIGFLRTLQNEMRGKCQVVQFRSEYNLAAYPHTLTPMKPTVGGWRDLFAIALDDLTALVSPKKIVYCEGRDTPKASGEERGMDAQAFNSIFADSKPDTLFVSSGGNTELDQRSVVAISILGKVFPTVEILVFKDRDQGSGKPIDEKDRQIYLATNPSNHRIMKRWEIENYLFDKEVLQSYTQRHGLTFDEASYDVFFTDIINQNVKGELNRIKNLCGIKTSINADKFKIELAQCVSEEMEVFKELEGCIFRRE